MLFVRIPKPSQGRRFAITDIHGCLQTFKVLLQNKLCLRMHDHVYLLGDYIHRGPDSKGVIDFILQLQREGFRVFPLRGNHEQMVLNFLKKNNRGRPVFIKQGSIVGKEKQIDPSHAHFIETLPYYYDLGDFYLVHAGFDFSKEKPFEDTHSMLWMRKFGPGLINIGKRKIVHGHIETPLEEIRKTVSQRNKIICIDGGCHRKDAPYGHLCGLDLDNFDLYFQEYID